MRRHGAAAALAVVLLLSGCSGDDPVLVHLQDDPMADVLPTGAREVTASSEAGGPDLLGKDTPSVVLRTLEAEDGDGKSLLHALTEEAEGSGWVAAGPVDEQAEDVVALFTRDPGPADHAQLALTWDRGRRVLITLTGR